MRFDSPAAVMQQALRLAQRGLGAVEPNPLVGAVLVNDRHERLGEGWHQRYGGPHAEIHAIQQAGETARGATLFVTLEPCCHHGKTPPCTQSVIAAGIRRVIAATVDPNPQMSGQGLQALSAAGLIVEVGLLQPEANALIAPFRKLITSGRPWLIAKWAMTLDGKIATHSGDSRWISHDSSRHMVHELRGRVDAIVTGIGTVLADDPLLTARPSGLRTATRVIVDSQARLPLTSQLVTTAREFPVLLASTTAAPQERVQQLKTQGVEVVGFPADAHGHVSLPLLCDELGRRRFTNVLVEGGGELLGGLFDAQLIDEVYTFIAPKLIGGARAPSPIAGRGLSAMQQALPLMQPEVQHIDGDVLIHGRLNWTANAPDISAR